MPVAIAKADSYDSKEISHALSNLFDLLGFDEVNPLGHIIKPGNTVFIKPNWVTHEYRKSCTVQDDIYCCITHPSLIRAVAATVDIALQGKGRIIIGDNPAIDADFDSLMTLSGLGDLSTQLATSCEIIDLRPLRCDNLRDYGNKRKMISLSGDPAGTTIVNLGKSSKLYGVNPFLFRGIFNQRWETIWNHFGNRQRYGLSSSIVNADVYISLPKLKTHHKVGTTLNLKGLVGANTIKNYLVHWRVGWPAVGGDEYPTFKEWFRSKFEPVVNRGAWHGNDTIWRMVVDLYNAFNSLGDRKTFSIIDGIIGGQGNGPFCPRAKTGNVLIGSEDLLQADLVGTRLMGFDVEAIPYLSSIIHDKEINTDDIEVVSDGFPTQQFFRNKDRYLAFAPPSQWTGIKTAIDKNSK